MWRYVGNHSPVQADVSPGVLRRHAANPAMAVTIAAGLAALPAAAVNMLLPNLCFGDQITPAVQAKAIAMMIHTS